MNAGIVLLTYNGEKYLRETLGSIAIQTVLPAAIVAIDSTSSDSTISILSDFDVQVHSISKDDFSHSTTRNAAVSLLSTEFVVFLTQDATPADAHWLENLLAPFEYSEEVVGVYGRQIPRAYCDELEKNDIRTSFGHLGYLKSGKLSNVRNKEFWNLIHFSNVSSAYRRKALTENPFSENLEMAEDQEWAKRMLEKGYTLVYEPRSVVHHSHNLTLREKYDRNFRMGESFSRFLSPQMGKRRLPLVAWAYHVLTDFGYAFENRTAASFRALLRSPFDRAFVHYAFHTGWNSEWKKQRMNATRHHALTKTNTPTALS